MTAAVDTRIQADGAAATGTRAPKTGPRRRLFAKYAAALVGLVGLVLLVNGILNVWFSYHEARDAAIRLQHEKADAAAQRIEDYIAEIEKQIGWTTATQWASSPIDQRRFDYGRLQRQVPAITELTQLDGQGHEQLKVSRLAMDVQDSRADYSGDPRFTEALAKKVWFGPVYFRKESEPYMTMSVAQSGRNAGVTVAEVNLKLIWDVITAIKIGKTGYAYVVDDKGRLIAHPDISRVLRNTDLTALPQVAAARSGSTAATGPGGIAGNLDGHPVLSASAPIRKLGWFVFVEQPISEALAPLYTAALNTGFLLLLGLAVAILAGLLLARRMTGPIRELDAGAARIGAGALDHRIAVHTGDELEELAKRFNTMAADLQSSYADLEKKVEDRTAELKESLDQQTATSEVLGVINSSPGDLAPVFDAMLEKATSLCEAAHGNLWTYDGERFHPTATHGSPRFAEWLRQHGPVQAPPGSIFQRLVRGEDFVQIADAANDNPYLTSSWSQKVVEITGARTVLVVPLRRDNALLGAIFAYRQEMRPFSDKQIALLQNFAAQAVIAMENARLITETQEALEQQTATAEVLGVINSSPGDLIPVFDAMLDKAMRLCNAAFGYLMTYDGERFQEVAHQGLPPRFAEYLPRMDQPGPSGAYARIKGGAPWVHIADLMEGDVYLTSPLRQALVDLGGARTGIIVALRKDEALLGVLTIYRQEVRPFSDKQIALLENFAAQAVIAMENARLITETHEALEQQTATAEVLGVINSSPGDLTPVFDAMLEKAMHLCDAAFGTLWTYDGACVHAVALHNVPPVFAEFLTRAPHQVGPDSAHGRLLRGEPVVHIPDIVAEKAYQLGDPIRRALVELGGGRTLLAVPLRTDDAFLGDFVIYRQEARLFSDKQIALLQSFAAQAVIAMENARLLGELRQRTGDLQESLEYQTASSDVLKVISRSAFDLDAVLEAVVSAAIRLCRAEHAAIYRNEDGEYRWAAGNTQPPEYERIERSVRIRPGQGTLVGRTALEGRTVQIPDVLDDPLYEPKEDARVGNARTMLGVPLLRENASVGVIGLVRNRVEPFSEREIALVRTFADQAVIAIENARLFNELQGRTHDLQESLEYQTATSDVLRVISQSTFDLGPVLENVIETALRLCRAKMGSIFRLEHGSYRWAVGRGLEPAYEEIERRTPIPPGPGTLVGRAAIERRVVHVADADVDPLYVPKDEARIGRVRTMLGVPLLREGVPIGVIAIARDWVEAFNDKEVALVQTFADQAVIAIENARLFNELRERTSELGRSVEELKMLSEVGRAVSSTLDLRAVLSTILTRSVGLTGADAGAIYRYSRADRSFRLAEAVGWDASLLHSIGDLRILESETAMGEATARRAPVQLADLVQRPSAPLRDVSLAAGYRGALIVPLVGPERILGALVLQRRAAGEFPPEALQLMQTLASQSVLAIQNARLFREIADKSEQLALASQHKSQFLANMSHELRTPLNAILGYAELLVDGIYGALPDRPKGVLERIQNNGKHLLALINDVLDLAKIEAGQLTLTLEDYALAEVVRSVVTATEPLATSKGLNFTATLQDDMPIGHGDARRLSQVLLNLVGNAIKFTEAGEVEICASSANGQFVLSVRDTGPGIADADQDRIFGEFQQVDNTNTRNKGGTGLGLAISKRMIEMQGGTISVESAFGQGSTFRVVLPVHVDEMMEAAE